MNNYLLISYTPGVGYIERLTGSTKVKLFIASLFLIMASFDIRIIFPLFVFQVVLLCMLKPNLYRYRYVLLFVVAMNLLNIFLFYLASPLIGSAAVGKTTVLFRFNSYFVITAETLFYFFTRLMKITAVLIASLWFVFSITPSQLAAGLYSLKVPNKICTVASLGLRYIPDIFRDYTNIKTSMQMRGVELDSKRTGVKNRIVRSAMILFPLIVVSFDKVSIIANAMDLRGFGQSKKKSFYCEPESTRSDFWFTMVAGLLFLGFLVYTISGYFVSRPQLWYPF